MLITQIAFGISSFLKFCQLWINFKVHRQLKSSSKATIFKKKKVENNFLLFFYNFRRILKNYVFWPKCGPIFNFQVSLLNEKKKFFEFFIQNSFIFCQVPFFTINRRRLMKQNGSLILPHHPPHPHPFLHHNMFLNRYVRISSSIILAVVAKPSKALCNISQLIYVTERSRRWFKGC